MPILLEEIRKNNKDVKISILIATGMHRPTTYEELVNKYGQKIVDEENIIIHNDICDSCIENLNYIITLMSNNENDDNTDKIYDYVVIFRVFLSYVQYYILMINPTNTK